MNNPLEMLKMIKNPQQAVFEMISNNSNPILKNAIEMAKKGDDDGVMKLAQNLCKEKGIDFDKEFNEFMSNIK